MRRTGKPTLWLLASCLGLAGLLTISGCNTGSREGSAKKSTSAPGVNGTPAAPAGPAPSGLAADLRVDANRDGALTADDENGEDTWSATAGAVLLNNNDDDDGDGVRDGTDSTMNGATDRDDMTPVLLLQAAQLTSQHQVTLNIDGNLARGRVRLFNDQGTVIYNPGAAVANISPTDLAAGDVTIYMEAREGRSSTWDGDLTLTLTISDANGPISQDVVALRVAPVIFLDNTRPVDRVYVLEITDPAQNPNQGLMDPLNTRMPAGVDLYKADGATYGFDRWVQDAMQQGYQAKPGAVRRSNLQAMRPRPLDPLTPAITGADTGHTWTGGMDSSHNYGGNLEITPAYAGFPFGRIVIGGGQAGTLTAITLSDTMTQRQVDWLNAQEVQGPCFEVSSEWLIVGHIDETFIFLPDGQGGFHLYMASPTLARQALQALANSGQGSKKVFEGRSTETTVQAMLNDQPLLAFNQAAQARLDQIRDALIGLVGIAASDVRYFPVLFEEYTAQGHAVALNPGVQNLVCVNAPSGATTLFVPDPEGPNDNSGVDVWQEQIRQTLASTGFTIEFVDVFESYHELLGEAHCGTNTERQPYAKNWWD